MNWNINSLNNCYGNGYKFSQPFGNANYGYNHNAFAGFGGFGNYGGYGNHGVVNRPFGPGLLAGLFNGLACNNQQPVQQHCISGDPRTMPRGTKEIAETYFRTCPEPIEPYYVEPHKPWDSTQYDKYHGMTAQQLLDCMKRKYGKKQEASSSTVTNSYNRPRNSARNPVMPDELTYDTNLIYADSEVPKKVDEDWEAFAKNAKKYELYFEAAGAEYNLDPDLLKAISLRECGIRPNEVSSTGKHFGLMQISEDLIKKYKVKNWKDPEENIMAGAAHLRWLLDNYYENDIDWALAAYNWGQGKVNKHRAAGGEITNIVNRDNIKDQTRTFVPAILTYYNWFKGGEGEWSQKQRSEVTMEYTAPTGVAKKIVNSAITTVSNQTESGKCFRNVKDALIPIFGFRPANPAKHAFQAAEAFEELMASDKLDSKNLEMIEINVNAGDSVKPGDIIVYNKIPGVDRVDESGHIGIFLGNEGPEGKEEASSSFYTNGILFRSHKGIRVFRVQEKPAI